MVLEVAVSTQNFVVNVACDLGFRRRREVKEGISSLCLIGPTLEKIGDRLHYLQKYLVNIFSLPKLK